MRKYSYAAKVKAMREERAWPQEQLAAISGVSVRTVQRIERDDPASLESLKAIASAFQVDVRELLDTASSLYLSQERSPVLSMNSDYWHDDSLRFEKRLEELRQARNQAEQEAQHAQTLNLGLEGPRKAAEAAVERLSAQIVHAERLRDYLETKPL